MTENVEMRRLDRRLPDNEALRVASACHEAVLATAGPDGAPYAVPVNTVVLDGAVYFHAAKGAGRKSANMTADPRVCLVFVAGRARAEKEFSTNYASAVAEGRAVIVSDPAERRRAMMAFCSWNAGSAGEEAAGRYFDAAGGAVDVWRVDISRLAGKARNKELFLKD